MNVYTLFPTLSVFSNFSIENKYRFYNKEKKNLKKFSLKNLKIGAGPMAE